MVDLNIPKYYTKTKKYRNVPVRIDGIYFHSKKEANRWQLLKIMQKKKEIKGLEMQVRFPFHIGGVHICDYIADFVYLENDKRVVEDVKSPISKTPIYRIKKALLLALYGLEIRET